MKKNLILMFALIGILGVFVVMPAPRAASAQPGEPAFSTQELDQMLAPIALYPDSLLAQILIAATYPDQVVEADLWLKTNPGLKGEVLNASLDKKDWDLSIKALAPFPEVLDMMAREPKWTQKLGEAFLSQQDEVMDSIQRLRRKAEAAGNLSSTDRQKVVVKENYIEIEPINPEIIYVPRYNPAEVYGAWGWPAYPPFAYYPVWPGVVAAPVGVYGFWGAVTVGPAWGWGWGRWGWGGRHIYLNVNRTININTRNMAAANRMRRGLRTTSLRQAMRSGRFGLRSPTWRAARERMGRRGARPGAVRHPRRAPRRVPGTVRPPRRGTPHVPGAVRHPSRGTRGAPGAVRHPRRVPLATPGAVRHPRRGTRGAPGAVRHPRRGTRGAPGAVRHPRRVPLATPGAVRHPRKGTRRTPGAVRQPRRGGTGVGGARRGGARRQPQQGTKKGRQR